MSHAKWLVVLWKFCSSKSLTKMIYLSLTGHLSLHPFAGIPCGYEVSGTDPFSQEDHAGYQQPFKWWKRVASIFAASQLLACGPFKQKQLRQIQLDDIICDHKFLPMLDQNKGIGQEPKFGTWPPKLEVTEFLGLGLLLFETHMIPKIHSEYDAKDLRN